jgi:hypothetical protein
MAKTKTTAKKAPKTRAKATAKNTTADLFAILRKKETNGDNYDVSTDDIIARLKKWQKLCSFQVASADYNVVKLKFDTLPKNLDAFLSDASDLCPDLVQVDESVDFPLLKKEMLRTKKLTLWWD